MKLQTVPYFGGKGAIYKWILANFPEHDYLVDAFGGSGVIILNDTVPGLYNEIDPDLFWMMINIKWACDQFVDRLREVEYCESTCKSASKYFKLAEGSFDRSVAYYTWQRMRYAGGEAAGRGFKWTGRQTWENMLLKLPVIAQRLQNITISNKSALELLPLNPAVQRGTKPLIYLDPPYPRGLRTRGLYKYEFDEHEKLMKLVEPYAFVLSSYDSTLPYPHVKKPTRNQNGKAREEYLYIHA